MLVLDCGLIEMYVKSGDRDSLSCSWKIFYQIS